MPSTTGPVAGWLLCSAGALNEDVGGVGSSAAAPLARGIRGHELGLVGRPGTMGRMHPKEQVVRDLYAARARGDLVAVTALLDPDIEWHEPYEYLGHLRGRAAVLDALRETIDATRGSFRIELHDVLASDDHAVALVEWGAERDGRALSGHEVAVYHVRDGRVSEVWFYTEDTHGIDEIFA